jgi:YVTN family beta-propeller protein
VGLENQDAVLAIDTLANKIIATIPVGQQPQALVYVPGAVPYGEGMENLIPLGDAGRAAHLTLSSPRGDSAPRATVSINAIGSLDLLQAAVTGLKPGQAYTLWLVASRTEPYGKKESLATFNANLAGAQIVQTIGPLRQILAAGPTSDPVEQRSRRYLLVTPADAEAAVLIQRNISPF